MQQLQNVVTLFNFVVPTFSSMLLYYFAATSLIPASAPMGERALTMGMFVAFSAAFGMFVSGMTSACNTLVDVMDSVAKSKLIRPIFEAEPEVGADQVDPGRLSGSLRLKDITFRYRPDGPLILQDATVHAEPGEFIALVGPSGSGKSTIIRLLLGFEKPEFGTISYDGQDLADLDVTAVRRQIGVVLQSQRINATSILSFVTGGMPLSLDEVWEVLREVGLSDDVREMPMGLHTVISEGGGNLSGGQRQRLVIARALAQDPKILIFDEATSALDNRTQAIVSDSIRHRRVTRLAIAHRLSTIRTADRIYVLDRGHIVQSGTFDELANTEGLFQRMMARQMT